MSSQAWLVEAATGLTLGAAVAVLAPHGQVDPARGESGGDARDPAAKAHALDVASYTMRAVLDPTTRVVHGDGTIVWRNTSSVSTRELWFHLYLNAFKNERTSFIRGPVGGGGRGSSMPTDWGHIEVRKLAARELDGADLWLVADKTSPGDAQDETDIRIPLPRDVAPGETLTLDAVWDAKLPSIVERTGYANDFFMVAQWFPKIARLEPDGEWRHFAFHRLAEFYADFGSYEVTIDVPSGTVVGATGSCISSTRGEKRDRFVFRQRDVHDFSWTAWPAFREKTARAEGVELRILYPPGYETVAARQLDIAAFGLSYFGTHYGRYPYPTLTIVHPPSFAREAGGMEYPTLMTTGGPWYQVPFLHDLESLVLHELGHQYFYGVVATDEERWPFLDEGVDTFAESDALSALLADGAGVGWPRFAIDARARLRSGAAAVGHGESMGAAARDFASGWSYAALVYSRAAAVLDTLARVYGRGTLLRAIGGYARRYRFEHPTLRDFIGAIEDVVGAPAARNLERALFEQGWVDYQASEATSMPANDGTWEGWALIVRHGNLTFPVDVELSSADGAKQVVRWDGAGAWTRIPYRGTTRLAAVMVDPAISVTLDANLLNNGIRLGPQRSPHRTLERFTYFAALALEGLMP